ncbi:MAG TPA: hypothetical protein VM095_20660 [Pyrinomonadaceae bacterium]|nr:hypothetical protein [Pyrinomonadaceae bacterium]
MTDKIKKTLLFLLYPKAIGLGIAIFLYFLARDFESKRMVCCWDCGWDSGQASILIIASLGLVLNKLWSVMISLFLSIIVAYSVGYVAFCNNLAEAHETWQIVIVSMKWTAESHPEYFIEVIVAALISSYSIYFLCQNISRKYLSNRMASNNSLNRTRS